MDILKEKGNWVVKIPTDRAIDAGLLDELKFCLLAQRWYEETRYFSFAAQRENATYHEILALGAGILPFVLNEVRAGRHVWFGALRYLAKVDPVAPEHRGDTAKMAGDWLAWGAQNSLI